MPPKAMPPPQAIALTILPSKDQYPRRDYEDQKNHLVLKADAPDNCPHIIDFGGKPGKSEAIAHCGLEILVTNLSAVTKIHLEHILAAYHSFTVPDIVATVLLKWDPDALAALLDFSNVQFRWVHIAFVAGEENHFYVHRFQKRVSVRPSQFLVTLSSSPHLLATTPF